MVDFRDKSENRLQPPITWNAGDKDVLQLEVKRVQVWHTEALAHVLGTGQHDLLNLAILQLNTLESLAILVDRKSVV